MTLAIPTPPTSRATAPSPRNRLVKALSAAALASMASVGRLTWTWSGFSGLTVGGRTSMTRSTHSGAVRT